MNKLGLLIVFTVFFSTSKAQEITQTIKGQVIDNASHEVIPFASVVVFGTDPILGTTTDLEGNYIIENVPIGRYDIQVSNIGYSKVVHPEVVVSSTKMVLLDFRLSESAYAMDEIVVKAKLVKSEPINSAAMVSARMLSVEEANRYAGGFDDPARLAASYPGVASSVGNNAIVIRGNAPKFLQWKIEDVEVPNPNHFADLGSFGGGGLTALSSKLLANSDFYTGAFPAEYNNALSGVFDIRMRNGNSEEFEHNIELGIIGLDFASEGPMNKKKSASYLTNYRYSTLGLIAPLLPEDAQGTSYQDLSYKLKWKSKKMGSFSLWGIGLMDKSGTKPEMDAEKQVYFQDIEKQDVLQYMGASGLNHKLVLKNAAYVNSTLAFSTNGLDLNTERLDSLNVLQNENRISNTNYNYTLKSSFNKKYNAKHTNKVGITVRGMSYKMALEQVQDETFNLQQVVNEKGFSALVSAYSNSLLSFGALKLNIGINTQWFTLNNRYTIEPRVGFSYQLNEKNKLSFMYGLHSRLEQLNIYFANTGGSVVEQKNKDLDFSKSHHFVLAYDWNISDKLHFKMEPYFQYLYDVPVIEGTTSSLLNLQNDWFINDVFVNDGEGMNMGVDLTLEQYINNGFYYLISASVFNSKYSIDQRTWYNTRYNKQFLANFLVGKEFYIGKKKQGVLGLNVKLSIQGGDRYSMIDALNSSRQQEVIYDESKPFTERTNFSFVTHSTVNYQWNKKKITSKLSLKILNATNYKEFLGHRYNIKTNSVEEYREAIIIPNLSYSITF